MQSEIQTSNQFFNKKRIINLSLFFCVTIIIIILTLVLVLNIDVNLLIKDILNGIGLSNHQFLFIIFLILFPFLKSFFIISFFVVSVKKLGIKIRKRDWINFTFTVSLITAITPSSLGSEPYIIFWLNKKIKNVKKASAITLGSNFIAQISSLIVTLPSFIYCMVMIKFNLSITTENVVFWFLIIGITLDVIVFLGILVIIYTKRIHFWFAIIFEKVKKILKKNSKTKEQIREEIIQNGDFKKEVIYFLKNWKGSIFSLFCLISYNILYYIAMFVTISLLIGSDKVDFWSVFNFTNIGVTANNFIPIPGSEGSLQIVLKILLSKIGFDVSILDNSIFIWRFSTTQFSSLIGVALLMTEGLKTLSSIKFKKINENLQMKSKHLVLVDDIKYLHENLKMKNYYELLTKNLKDEEIVIYETKNDNHFIFNQKKSVKQYWNFLKKNKRNSKKINFELKHMMSHHNYINIYDFSLYSTKILAKKNNYIWIQYLMYTDYMGEKMYKNGIKNLIAKNMKKIYLPYNPFYYNKNILVTHKCDLLIGNVNNSFYLENDNWI